MECAVESITPDSASHFFGFYDICPWDPQDREICLLRFPLPLDHHPDGSDTADICVWRPDTGIMNKIAETTAWNFQMGARLRWLSNGTLLFNDIERERDCTRIISREGVVLKTLPKGIATLSADEEVGIAPPYARLGAHYTPYGYRGAKCESMAAPHPADDGVWSVDLRTGTEKLLFSMDELSKTARLPENTVQFVSHPTFSPGGSRFIFAHTYETSDGANFSNLFLADRDGKNLRLLLTEKCGHMDWIDDDTILIWTRLSRALKFARRLDLFRSPIARFAVQSCRKWHGKVRNSLISEGFYRVSLADPALKERIATDTILVDGHLCIHPSGRMLVGDTYPGPDNHLQLFLYSFQSGKRVNISRFNHGVLFKDGGLRCDLHPRWNRAGTRIAVDTCEKGVRRLAVVDATRAIEALAG